MTGVRKACTVHVNQHRRLYYRVYWKGQEWKEGTGLRDNRENRARVRRHVLPELGDLYLDSLSWRDLANRQTDLLAQGVGVSAINRALHHALRAMLRDARKLYSFVASDLFDRSLWQRLPEDPDSDPDPYDEQERDLILAHFRTTLSHWHAFVFFQFWEAKVDPAPSPRKGAKTTRKSA